MIGESSTRTTFILSPTRAACTLSLRLVPLTSGEPARLAVRATPSRLSWEDSAGSVELTCAGPDTVRVRGTGVGLLIAAVEPALTPFSGPYLFGDPVDGSFVYTLYETGRRYRVTSFRRAGRHHRWPGTRYSQQNAAVRARRCCMEIAIEEFQSSRTPYRSERSFDQVAQVAQSEFTAFVDAVAPWRDDSTPAAELAAYVLRSAAVAPAGFLSRSAILMSKHWMNKVWSWDHRFNALALAPGAPRLAWDQYLTVFDHQDAVRRVTGLGDPLRGPLQPRQAAHSRLDTAPASSAHR